MTQELKKKKNEVKKGSKKDFGASGRSFYGWHNCFILVTKGGGLHCKTTWAFPAGLDKREQPTYVHL